MLDKLVTSSNILVSTESNLHTRFNYSKLLLFSTRFSTPFSIANIVHIKMFIHVHMHYLTNSYIIVCRIKQYTSMFTMCVLTFHRSCERMEADLTANGHY